MNLFSKLFRSRDKPMNHLGGFSFLFGQTAAGKAVNERTAMQTTAVYACVPILAESTAGLPLHVYVYKEQGIDRAIRCGNDTSASVYDERGILLL